MLATSCKDSARVRQNPKLTLPKPLTREVLRRFTSRYNSGVTPVSIFSIFSIASIVSRL